jgi:tetratricopeptide (TPR) repeat protein
MTADVLTIADELREEGVHLTAIDLYGWLLGYDDSAAAHFGIGQSYGKTGHYDAALEHLDLAFAMDPDRPTGYGYYAYILERAGRMAEADRAYRRALRGTERDDLWTRSHQAWFLEKDGRLDEAERTFQAILADSPKHTWSSKRYALLLRHNEKPAQARAVLTAAVRDGGLYARLNLLEYLLLTGAPDYGACRAELGDPTEPDWLPVLLELFNYYREHLLPGRPDPDRLARWTTSAEALTAGVHRDFDDLTALLADRNGDMATWRGQLARLQR